MYIQTFEDLLTSARQQPHAQRLLFVFTCSELPEDATPEQRARYEAGMGGALVPMMEVDKLPEELHSFTQLVEESTNFAKDHPAQNWAIVFAAALGGTDKIPPTSAQADIPLRRMADAIRAGEIRPYIAFDRQGEMVNLM